MKKIFEFFNQLSNRKRIILIATLIIAPALYFTGTLHQGYELIVGVRPTPAEHFLMNTSKFADEIKGSIITLRKNHRDVTDDVHLALSPTVRQGLSFKDPWTYESTYNFHQWVCSRIERGELISYLIYDNQDNKLIGAVEIRSYWALDPGQIGAWMNENYWGGGRIQESVMLMLNEYYKQTGKKVYNAEVEMFNIRSLKAFKKMGFVEKGIRNDLRTGKPIRFITEFHRR
jgi:RimJ/RimL family protein N-acetyltransferase